MRSERRGIFARMWRKHGETLLLLTNSSPCMLHCMSPVMAQSVRNRCPLKCRLSGGKPDSLCSLRVFRILTQSVDSPTLIDGVREAATDAPSLEHSIELHPDRFHERAPALDVFVDQLPETLRCRIDVRNESC